LLVEHVPVIDVGVSGGFGVEAGLDLVREPRRELLTLLVVECEFERIARDTFPWPFGGSELVAMLLTTKSGHLAATVQLVPS
jgi:hypothetical protein